MAGFFLGFFAPEMIIQGSYFGDKADVWSVGCILLELVLGHEKFCDIWMTAYDYEILQNKELFTTTITDSVDQLPDFLTFSNDLNDFIMRFLEMRALRRPQVRQLGIHQWLNGIMEEEITNTALAARLHGNEGRPYSPPSISSSQSFSLDNELPQHTVSQDALRQAFNNLSEKERRQMEEYILQHKNSSDNVMKLPPITPATPNIGNAKKILRKGNELASRSYGPSSDSHSFFTDNHITSASAPVTPMNMNAGFQSPTTRSPLPSVSEQFEDAEGKSSAHFNNLSYACGPMSPLTIDTKPSLLVSNSESQIFNKY